MRTRNDVLRYFTYQPPRADTAEPAKAIHAAVKAVEEYASGYLAPRPTGELLIVTGGGSPAMTHGGADTAVRDCALTIFDTLPEVPGRTRALQTLWLVRGLLHAAIRPPVNFTNQAVYREAALVRLAEVRIQAIGAVVLETK